MSSRIATLAQVTLLLLPWLAFPRIASAEDTAGVLRVGVAKVDITPDYPIRLNGFGFRRTESEGVTQQIWAKALVIDDGSGGPALLMTVDILGIPEAVRTELVRRLAKQEQIRRDRVAIAATHTHTAPMLKGANPTIFGTPIPPEHLATIDRYYATFLDRLEEVARAALADRKPARLSWGVGSVGFATNRRQKGGPVDHDLPVLAVHGLDGKLRAVHVTYACHCVTLSHNKIGGDWAGHAEQAIEDTFPGAVSLVSIGCGADANPNSGVTGDKVEIASRQGMELAAEVRRLLTGIMTPVVGPIRTEERNVELPLAPLPTREEWEKRAEQKDAIGHHARVQLARLKRGEQLQSRVVYPIQTWTFGEGLALVFLPGEVVVDYAVRLKQELDVRRLWIVAYTNDAPCYIPSERVLKEGGYEGGGAMIYYDVPVPFAPGLEDRITGEVARQLGGRFRPVMDSSRLRGSKPRSPQQSLALLRPRPGTRAELVAAEPLVDDPVAIDFGPDGKVWVAEMADYPNGKQGKFEPGGRVRVLRDTDQDGRFDRATVFLDGIPFPTGVTAWRNGVLVCAAPDILFAEDTDGDDRADVVKKLFSGFGTGNYQARVNSLELGLDGWVHGSCGLFGGRILNHLTGKTFNLGDRDFRIRPDTGEIEAATGRTQQGRVRDDWGNWFGCDNSTLLLHHVLPDQYLRRNPHFGGAAPVAFVPEGPQPNRLYSATPAMQLFKLSGPPNNTTAACGLGIYRDDLLGPEFVGNAFTCEPVNLLVHRLRLFPKFSTFAGRRAEDEQDREFLASSDPWFRPVQVRTAPDGTLWVVDMYRFVIEHTRWIPPEDVAKLDVRAGQGFGRIYRILPEGRSPRPWARLDHLDTAGLVAALDSPNGWQRDRATWMLVWTKDHSAVPALERMAGSHPRPEARLHALVALDGLDSLTPEQVRSALGDAHPGVRRHAARLAEKCLNAAGVGAALLACAADADAQVRLQAALSLGDWRDERASRAVAGLALRNSQDVHLVAAVLSGVRPDNISAVLSSVLASAPADGPPSSILGPLVSMAASVGDERAQSELAAALTRSVGGRRSAWQLAALATLLDAKDRAGRGASSPLPASTRAAIDDARRGVSDDSSAPGDLIPAIALLGREPDRRAADLDRLELLLAPTRPVGVQSAALAALSRTADSSVPDRLLSGWPSQTPARRGEILDVLLGRPGWQRALLDALEKQTIAPGEIDAARRQRLLSNPDESIRRRAVARFQGTPAADRERVLRDYRIASTGGGDRTRGKSIFAKSCAACHQLEGVGSAVGPDLAALAGKQRAQLLLEILDPSRNLDSRYVEYLAVTRSGKSLTGLLAGETSTSIRLRGQQGKDETILRSDLEELRSSGRSLMPVGLEKEISPASMADLLAYLTGVTPPRKVFPGNQPAVVRPVAGALTLPATSCEIFGGQIAFESQFRNVGMWHGLNDHVVWRVELPGSGEFDLYIDYACDERSAGNAFVVEVGEAQLKGKVESTGGWQHYHQVRIGRMSLPAGKTRIVFRPDGETIRGALIDLRTLYLVVPGRKPPTLMP